MKIMKINNLAMEFFVIPPFQVCLLPNKCVKGAGHHHSSCTEIQATLEQDGVVDLGEAHSQRRETGSLPVPS